MMYLAHAPGAVKVPPHRIIVIVVFALFVSAMSIPWWLMRFIRGKVIQVNDLGLCESMKIFVNL